ncbi:MAG: MBL fold metallo-hydrolase [Alphaproteobacteria bacterium]|uniref:MBL fold metallo-hydrolase n=1 Tax=Brevundimonas sp. TaxID=1871086 RepID=UPI001D836DE3|nr:MBL fold metallo-hydrolase [Alphaproteobacteria bacterium]MBU1520979.1 MBL fold metallo-hydrolase [Alphaproteobacteria bacterium]MBU2031280.1 MBL fold metallo-hydrolase [Alphaproteobacteria bacterium]MBU2163308.1 MBL fold metallo-hydrolase [Alphaproteobacteria bacterium]MBU2230606.1 MBL fold metallo-hydrolase [Alphaproteobacteria bacterium]
MTLRRIALAFVVLLALAIGALAVFQRQIGARMLERIADTQVGRDTVATLPDGVNVALCGTGSPMPDPTRAGPCSVVMVGGKVFLVDSGEGSARNLARMGIPAARIEAIFLTHYHSDHIDGLAPVLLQRWVGGSHTQPPPLFGPEGVDSVAAGFNAAYALDGGYRTAHHGAALAPPSGHGATPQTFRAEAAAAPKGLVVYRADGLVVTAFTVNHEPVAPAVGYRFDYAGRSVVFSGDTAVSSHLNTVAAGADLLVHEALQPALLSAIDERLDNRGLANLAQIMRDIVDYHSTPEQAADAARAAGVDALVLNHLVPPQPLDYGYAAFLGDAKKHYAGPITVGEDGMLFSLPRGTDTILRRRLF